MKNAAQLLLPFALIALACGSPDTPSADDCGGAGSGCPVGFTCDPVDHRCHRVAEADASIVFDAAPLSPAPDASVPDAAPPPPPPPDAGLPDAPPPPDAALPAALAMPAGEDFGEVTIGESSSAISLSVTNNGGLPSGDLAVTLGDAATWSLMGGTCVGRPLAAGASCSVVLVFHPLAPAGAKSATITVAGSPGGTLVATLTGRGLTPGALQISPASNDFGEVVIGRTSSSTPFTVRNVGQSPAGMLGASLPAGSGFTIAANGCPTSLAAGASCTIGVRFEPGTVGPKQGVSLSVTSSPGGSAAASLRGTGTAVLTLSAAGGHVQSMPDGIDCGGACTGVFSVTPVVLSAMPDPGYTFMGWSGPCNGASECVVSLTGPLTEVDALFERIPSADLELTGSASASVSVGQPLSYSLAVHNLGADFASNVLVSQLLPAGATQVSASASQGTCNVFAGEVRCSIGGLSPSDSATLTVQITPSIAGTITSGASASADEVDPAPGNNSVSFSTEVTAEADLSISALTDAPDPLLTGASSTYTITVHNAGPGAANGVVLTDTLAASVTFVSASSGCVAGGQTVTCDLDTLASGADVTVSIVGTQTAAGTIGNSASVSAATADPDATNNTRSTTTTVGAVRRLTVTVNGDGGGTVNSSPAGITDCTGTCTADYASGTSVRLTARSSPGSRFGGWSGACSGIVRDACTVSMSAARSVTASFVTLTNNLIFVSSASYRANLGSAAAYDTKCNQLATAAGLNNAAGNAYVSWVDDSAGSLFNTRLGSPRGFIRVDGQPFVDDLVSGGWEAMNVSNLDENGRVVSSTVWTGANVVDRNTQYQCSDWKSLTGLGQAGITTSGAAGFGVNDFSVWDEGLQLDCSQALPVYCVMKTRTNPLVYTPATGKRIYVADWHGGVDAPGIAGANAACTAWKPAGAGTVVALLPFYGTGTNRRSAGSLLSTTATYVRPDGVIVGTGSEIRAGNLRSGIWQMGDGSYGVFSGVMTGTASLMTIPASAAATCNDFTLDDTGSGSFGSAPTITSGWWSAATYNCQINTAVYCIEQ